RGVAGLADVADDLTGANGLALLEERGAAQVHVGGVLAGAGAVDDDVVAGAALPARELHRAAAGGDDRRAAGRHDVLALVDVAGAAGAEAPRAHAEAVRAAQREGVVEEQERLDRRRRAAGLRRPRSGGRREDA